MKSNYFGLCWVQVHQTIRNIVDHLLMMVVTMFPLDKYNNIMLKYEKDHVHIDAFKNNEATPWVDKINESCLTQTHTHITTKDQDHFDTLYSQSVIKHNKAIIVDIEVPISHIPCAWSVIASPLNPLTQYLQITVTPLEAHIPDSNLWCLTCVFPKKSRCLLTKCQ